MVSEQAAPSLAKSALRIDGAMTAGGPIFVTCLFDNGFVFIFVTCLFDNGFVKTKPRRSAVQLSDAFPSPFRIDRVL